MCLILFAYDAHPRYRLVLAANRDEFHARPTAPAARWPDAPGIVAGRDLRDGGTWMGITPAGRWAAVTNYRDPSGYRTDAPSRGHLVADYLRGEATASEYLSALEPEASRYNGFNLLVGDRGSVHWFSNRSGRSALALRPGIYGLSNELLDTPWPKVVRGKRELARLLEAEPGPDPLLDLLLDRTLAADRELPATGVDLDRERALSAMFITTPEYGTRSSTALLIDRDGHALLVERTFAPGTEGWTEVRHRLRISGGS